MRGSTHVLLHEPHSARRLEIQAAAIEAYAFAYDRHSGIFCLAPFQLDEPRRSRIGGAAADCRNEWIAFVQLFPDRHPYRRTELVRRVAHRLLKLRRAEISSGRVHELAAADCRRGEPNDRLDLRGLAGKKCARAAIRLTLL